MPAKVDAEDRRRLLTLEVAELVAAEGIGALTNQRIAERLGASTTAVTHYFRNKRELLLHTYQTMASRSRSRVEHAIEHSDDPLSACLYALLPLDAQTLVEWKVWLAYQGMSIGDAELTEIWAARSATAISRIARLIAADPAARAARANAEDEARLTFALIHGISVQSIVEPVHWPPKRLRRAVDAELARLRRDRGRAS